MTGSAVVTNAVCPHIFCSKSPTSFLSSYHYRRFISSRSFSSVESISRPSSQRFPKRTFQTDSLSNPSFELPACVFAGTVWKSANNNTINHNAFQLSLSLITPDRSYLKRFGSALEGLLNEKFSSSCWQSDEAFEVRTHFCGKMLESETEKS